MEKYHCLKEVFPETKLAFLLPRAPSTSLSISQLGVRGCMKGVPGQSGHGDVWLHLHCCKALIVAFVLSNMNMGLRKHTEV